MDANASKKAIIAVLLVQLFDSAGLGLLSPVLPFMAEQLGAKANHVTQLVALYAIAAMVSSPVLGLFSDKVERKHVVVVTLLVSALSYAGMLYAGALLTLFVFRGLSGAMSGRSAVLNALVIDCSAPEERVRWVGWLGAMTAIGVALGPVLGALMVQIEIPGFNSLQTAIAGALLTAVATTLLVVVAVPSRATHTVASARTVPHASDVSKRAALLPVLDLLGLNFGLFVGFGAIFSATALYVEHVFGWYAAEAGGLMGLMAISVAGARVLAGHKLIGRFSAERVLLVAAIGFAAMLAACVCVATPVVFVTGYCLAAAGHTVATLCVREMVVQRGSNGSLGLLMGWMTSTGALGVATSSAFNGYLFERYAPGAPFIVCGVAVAITLLAWRLLPGWRTAEVATHTGSSSSIAE